MKESFQISTRTYFSIQHIQSAANFTRLAAKIEKEYDSSNEHDLYYEHQSYVTGAIFTSVAFLEATINEIFTDCSKGVDDGNIKELNKDLKGLLGDMWKLEVPRTAYFSILDKYQIALTLTQKENFNKGIVPYQDIDTLIKIRNALIHYEPESTIIHSEVDPNAVKEHKFEKRLRGKFSLNPLTGEKNSFFPAKCLSHGCSKWAVESSLQFADEFFEKLNIEPTYDHVRDKLVLE